ncbi:MAG: hypothetical protein IPH09_17290 [bacterium]|nr:hypothetical protein [bacterium]
MSPSRLTPTSEAVRTMPSIPARPRSMAATRASVRLSGVPSGSSRPSVNSPWAIGGISSTPSPGASSAAPAASATAKPSTAPRRARATPSRRT